MANLRQLFIAALLLGSGDAAADESPGAVVLAFYDRFVNLEPKDYGRPDYERVGDLLAPELLIAFQSQEKLQEKCARSAPRKSKPNMIDQNPFFLAPDGFKAVMGLKENISGERADVAAELSYDDFIWEDTVELQFVNSHWLVANITWGGGGSLKGRLETFMHYQCDA
jgi:hypothetical protein